MLDMQSTEVQRLLEGTSALSHVLRRMAHPARDEDAVAEFESSLPLERNREEEGK